MSQYQSLTFDGREARQIWRRNQNTIRFKLGAGLGPVAHTVLIAIMLSILGLIYLTQITKTSTYGYQLNDMQTKRDQLLSQKRDLEVESARLQALDRVQQSNVAKAMTTPAATSYAQN